MKTWRYEFSYNDSTRRFNVWWQVRLSNGKHHTLGRATMEPRHFAAFLNALREVPVIEFAERK